MAKLDFAFAPDYVVGMRFSSFAIAVFAALLAGCSQSDVKENLGLVREAPDEFRVVSRPPLSVPKEFYLTPPTPGAERSFGLTPQAQARDLVTGGRSGSEDMPVEDQQNMLADSAAPVVTTSPLMSSAEENFLKRAGAQDTDPAIREKLYQETATQTHKDPGMLDRLRGEEAGEPVVDAAAEKNRLEQNKKEKKSVTEGDVPVVDPKKKSTLERLFE